jgi:two-component system response regulator RegX3
MDFVLDKPNTEYTVLVVDDDHSFCEIMSELLGGHGYEVVIAYCVKEALDLLDQFNPDLVLTDIMMPETDGLTLIRYLRTRSAWSTIPLIVISAKVMPTDRLAAARAGADAFIAKPFSFRQLETTINAVLSPVTS